MINYQTKVTSVLTDLFTKEREKIRNRKDLCRGCGKELLVKDTCFGRKGFEGWHEQCVADAEDAQREAAGEIGWNGD